MMQQAKRFVQIVIFSCLLSTGFALPKWLKVVCADIKGAIAGGGVGSAFGPVGTAVGAGLGAAAGSIDAAAAAAEPAGANPGNLDSTNSVDFVGRFHNQVLATTLGSGIVQEDGSVDHGKVLALSLEISHNYPEMQGVADQVFTQKNLDAMLKSPIQGDDVPQMLQSAVNNQALTRADANQILAYYNGLVKLGQDVGAIRAYYERNLGQNAAQGSPQAKLAQTVATYSYIYQVGLGLPE